jgi:hypothetical protein
MGPPGGSNLITETESIEWTYVSNLRIDYVGLRFGIDRKFLNGRFNILFGSSLNTDFRLSAKESFDYEGLKVKTITDWNGTTVDSTIFSTSFRGASKAAYPVYFNVGINTGFRYNFEKVYIDLFVNNAFSWYGRYRNSSNDYFPVYDVMQLGRVHYSFEYGFRVGYLIPSKDKESKSDK